MALIQSWQYQTRAGIAAAAVAAGGQIIALGVLSKEVEGRRTDPQAQARKNIRDIALSAQGEVVFDGQNRLWLHL